MLLTSGAKHARFEASNEEASTSMLKVLYELLEHWTNVAMMAQAMRPGTRPRHPMTLELKKRLRTHRKTIDELPKMEHAVQLLTLVQTNPSTWTKHSTHALASAQTPAQARSLEFAAIQEDRTVSTVSASVAL